jgi:16S rRNA (guanine527-N7)-methyltransferase
MVHIHFGRDLFVQEMRQTGIDVSRETRDRLEAMAHNLVRWNKAINLVGKATLEEIWTRHFLDSAQLQALIPANTRKLVDLGSGAGFPGLVIAALRPGIEVTLIESDSRKAAYLGDAARRMELAVPPKVVAGRIEAVEPAQAEVVTARALAPLSKLLEWAERHRGDTAICLFHKGKGWQAELTEALKDWDIPSQPFASVTDLDAVILRVDAYKRKGPAGAPDAAALRGGQPKGRRRKDDDGD